MCKNIFVGNIYVRSKFSCVHSSHDLCVRAHAHSLEGTLVIGLFLTCGEVIFLHVKNSWKISSSKIDYIYCFAYKIAVITYWYCFLFQFHHLN